MDKLKLKYKVGISIIVLLLGDFFVGFSIGKLREESVLSEGIGQLKVQRDNLQREVNAKEEETQLILQNKAAVLKTTNEKYAYSTFGVYSPELVDKTMISTYYDYRRNSIVERRIELMQINKQIINVNSWEFAGTKSRSTDPNFFTDYAIFDGYENYGNPVMVNELEKQWKESYTNKNGIKMYWSYLLLPKGGIGEVCLDSFLAGRPTGHPMLLRIKKGADSFSESVNSIEIQSIKKDIEKVADTISLQVKH